MLNVRTLSPSAAFARRGALVVAGSALMYLSAQIAIPMWPVPITLQTLAIPLLVALLGRELGTLAVVAYLIEGLTGLPVFQGHSGGAVVFAGPTGGYLIGFPLAAYAVGTLYQLGLEKHVAARFVAVFLGTAIVFVTGVTWLDVALVHDLGKSVAVGVVPFVVGDLLKCLVAAAVRPGRVDRAR